MCLRALPQIVFRLLVVLVLLAPVNAIADTPLVLDSAQFVPSDATTPPPDSAAWKSQALPDNWDVSRPNAWGYAWYRLRFDLRAQPTQPYAMYLPYFKSDGLVFVNGIYVGRTAPSEQPYAGPPQLFTIPPLLLHAGTNRVHLRLLVRKGWTGAVSAVAVGDERTLRSRYEHDYFLRITGPLITSILSVLLGLLILSLWLQRRQESMYGYFGLVTLLSGVSYLYDCVAVPPIPLMDWLTLMYGLDHLIPVLSTLFALRYAGWRWPRIERWLWIYAVASFLIIYMEQLRLDEDVHVWRFTYYPVIFCYLTILAIAAQRRPAVERVLLTMAVLFQAFTHVYEVVSAEFLDDLGIYLIWPYRALPLYVAIGWILVDRFVRSLNAYEKLSVELEQRVEEKHDELERNYRHIREMEQERAVVGERRRIMSDMHDGVGGQLISTLSLVEQGSASNADIAAALRECIDDLRLTIDSLEPTENDLLPALGNLRYRLEPRLKTQGIGLDWQVSELPRLSCLTPQNMLHVLRILQEAFTNVLKHAQASMVSVATGVDASGESVYIRLRDNGGGFANDHVGYGRRNMQQRARIIGGALEIQSSPMGTTLNLLLPVN